eukprot:TRINITY_DN330_c0_g1_i5.p1 TRINITY_DN330_c0_g1~~TRINITY_DN330_c0_g1_i5.p1  ORF type:complete len:159 (-),score=21.65 TRINITY_DN330_c0_g1_i5:115-591(-)
MCIRDRVSTQSTWGNLKSESNKKHRLISFMHAKVFAILLCLIVASLVQTDPIDPCLENFTNTGQCNGTGKCCLFQGVSKTCIGVDRINKLSTEYLGRATVKGNACDNYRDVQKKIHPGLAIYHTFICKCQVLYVPSFGVQLHRLSMVFKSTTQVMLIS